MCIKLKGDLIEKHCSRGSKRFGGKFGCLDIRFNLLTAFLNKQYSGENLKGLKKKKNEQKFAVSFCP